MHIINNISSDEIGSKYIITMVVVVAMLIIPVVGLAAVGYTTRTAFDAATTGFTEKVTANFDYLPVGYEAETIGNMDFYLSGLASDGLTMVGLSGIVTNAFTATTGSNTLGVYGLDHSFLAGNSDITTIRFSFPVNAFGCYLIGNPSPTGNPAIPFWRMRANTSSGFEVFSTTDPLYNLGMGNDVYFIGVISLTEPFNELTIYSDNDPAAVYSFNVDDIIYANVPQACTLENAKSVPSGTYIFPDLIVTRVHSDRINVETSDRRFGMMVKGVTSTRGKAIAITGSVNKNSEGEVFINAAGIDEQKTVVPPGPLGMTSLSVGGSTTIGQQNGINGSIGPNNIGLDAAVWGEITAITPDDTWMTIDDGAGRPLPAPAGDAKGIIVLGPTSALGGREPGEHVNVRGSVTLVEMDGVTYPAIRVADPGDIVSY